MMTLNVETCGSVNYTSKDCCVVCRCDINYAFVGCNRNNKRCIVHALKQRRLNLQLKWIYEVMSANKSELVFICFTFSKETE